MGREKYNVSIECPECGQSGVLGVSENDYPFMKKLSRSVRVEEGEFDASMINDSAAKIECGKCHKEFRW